MMVVVSEKVAMAKGEGMCERPACWSVAGDFGGEIERGQDRKRNGRWGFGGEEKEWAVVPAERTI